MVERRHAERYWLSTPASLVNGHARHRGMIVDVSASGARMRLSAPAILSVACMLDAPEFEVSLPGRIIWRRGLEIGIRFASSGDTTPEVHVPRAFGRRMFVVTA